MYLLHLVSSSSPYLLHSICTAKKKLGGGGISCIKCQVEQNIKKWGVNQEFCTVLYVQLKLTMSDVKSAGSSDILATARVESLPTSALYGASFP